MSVVRQPQKQRCRMLRLLRLVVCVVGITQRELVKF